MTTTREDESGKPLDVITIGRASVDLYGQQIGTRLEDIGSFAKSVGGCPANIAVGTARLGLKSALLTRVGAEQMGGFIKEQLAREGIETKGIVTDPERQLPTGTEPVAGTPFDLRQPTLIGDRHLDDAFTELNRDRDGLAWVRLTGPDGRTVELWADTGYPVVQLYTADTLAPDRRRTGVAAEPMTCPADAFRTGDHLVRLEPGSSHSTAWGVRLT